MEYPADATSIVRENRANEIRARKRAHPAASNSEGQHPEVVESQGKDEKWD